MEGYDIPVVIDSGSGSTRVGASGYKLPSQIFPTVVGVLKHPGILKGMKVKDYYIGEEATQKRNFLTLRLPVEFGYIENWEYMEEIWRDIFETKLIGMKANPVLLTEPPLNPDSKREKAAEVMFEKFEVPALNLSNQAELALYASGRTTGVIVDSGYLATRTVPIYEGHALHNSVKTLKIGGRDLTERLLKIQCERGYSFTTSYEQALIATMKEEIGYVSLDFDREMQQNAWNVSNPPAEVQYDLPDGSTITQGTERYRCSEPLFQPSFTSIDDTGVHHKLFESITQCDIDLQPAMFGNVVLAGGSTMFKGFAERLSNELTTLAPSTTAVRVIAPKERKYSAWLGGSTMSAFSTFKELLISKAEYEEHGPAVLKKARGENRV